MPIALIGDWKGSTYDVGGRRTDFHLFLDHDGHFERTIHRAFKDERRDSGRWELLEAERVLRLKTDGETDPSNWSILSITKCEGSNVLLVLRRVGVISRNLPIVLYRVHGDGRAYGTDWQRRLAESAAAGQQAEEPEKRQR